MIRLFSQICKQKIIFRTISEKNLFSLLSDSPDFNLIRCPVCGALHSFLSHSSYTRNFVTYDDSTATVRDDVLTVQRLICNSCGHTHALLPFVVVPYMSYSLKFVISLFFDYITHRFPSIEELCCHYTISISTFYRLKKSLITCSKLYLGMIHATVDAYKSLIVSKHTYDFPTLDSFCYQFYLDFKSSFLQTRHDFTMT